MKIFEEEDIKILKSYSNFNSDTTSIQFKSNTNFIYIKSKEFPIMSSYNLGRHVDKTFSIFDLKRFINSLSLFDELPEIELFDNYCKIGQGNTAIKYAFSSPLVVNKNIPDDKYLPFLSNEREIPTDISFSLTSKVIKDIKKSQGILSLPDIGIFGEDNKLYIRTYNKSNMSGDSYSIEIGESDKDFILVVSSTFRYIYDAVDYIMTVKSDTMLSKISSEKLNYIITLDAESKVY